MERLDEIRLKAFASRHAGVSNEMFDTLTPSELAAVLQDARKEREAEEKRKTYCQADIKAAIANTVLRKSRKVYTAKDFLPKDFSRPKSAKELDNKIGSVMRALATRAKQNGKKPTS